MQINSFTVVKLTDPDPDLSWLDGDRCETDEERAQNAARLAACGTDWEMVGVRARAEIVVAGVLQTIESAGLWGIESDSSDDYFYEVGAEELAQLKEILAAMGATDTELSAVDMEFYP